MKTSEPDYIVIGGGSAGAVLANRLSAPGGGTVLLLEAGGRGRGLRYRMPLAATKLWFDPAASWMLWSEPEPGLGGRRIPVPRGKALGGSSAINGTIYNRGSAHDYDQWATFGLEGWDYAHLLPYFRRIEDHWRGADQHHGSGGEVAVTRLHTPSPFAKPFIEAARQMGLAVSDDHLGPQMEGIGSTDLNVDRKGRRVSSADAFLRPIMSRPSLKVKTDAHVVRIIVQSGRAVGVDYLHDDQQHTVRAAREVILAGGAIASPQLLLLSGIGPADSLRSLGIAPVLDLPGVGQGLNDQPGASFEFEALLPFTFQRALRADRFAVSLAQWALGFGGAAAGPPMVAMGALRTDQAGSSPDLRMMLAAATRDARVWFPGVVKGGDHKLMMNFAVAHPESRGSISLSSSDPMVPPRILFNLLTATPDMVRLRGYYRLLLELIRQPAFAHIAGTVTRPSPEPEGDTELDAYLRSVAGTTSHPMGSCRMGVDQRSVVDAECRVRGIEQLRVIDASIFPTQISGNPHAAVMMLGDRVSDMIIGRPALPPERSAMADASAAG